MYSTYNDGKPITMEKLDFRSFKLQVLIILCAIVQNIDK
jgi:hypothetical protein